MNKFKLVSPASSLYGLMMLAAVCLPASIRAQASPAAAVSVEKAEATGPRALQAAPWAMQTNAPRVTTRPQTSPHVGRDVAMMAAGGAGIVVGSLIGGDGGMMIALGGGVIGILGLYNYLR